MHEATRKGKRNRWSREAAGLRRGSGDKTETAVEIKCQGGKLLPGKAKGCCGGSPTLLQFPLPCARAGLCPDPSSGHQDPWDPLGHQGHSRTRCPKEKILALSLSALPLSPAGCAGLGSSPPHPRVPSRPGKGRLCHPGAVGTPPVSAPGCVRVPRAARHGHRCARGDISVSLCHLVVTVPGDTGLWPCPAHRELKVSSANRTFAAFFGSRGLISFHL